MKWILAKLRHRILLARLLPLRPARQIFYLAVLFVAAAAFVEGVLAPGILVRRQMSERHIPAPNREPSATAGQSASRNESPSGSLQVEEPHPIVRAIEFAIGGVDWRAEKEKQAREAAARDIEAKVRKAHTDADSQVALLEGLHEAFRAKLQQNLAVPRNVSPLPDGLLLLFANERSAADAWSIIVKLHVNVKPMKKLRDNVDAVRTRMAVGTFRDEDRELLDSIRATADSMANSLPEQESALAHIKVLLDSQQFIRGPTRPQRGD